MKVSIDIQSAIAQRAGVGRYTKSLVEHLGEFADDDRLNLFYFDFKREGVPFQTPHVRQKAVRWCPGRLAQYAWKSLDWPPYDWFAGKADLYHFPNFIRPPLWSGKSVATIHDVSFMRFPEATEERNLEFLTAQIRNTVEKVDAIITDSRFSGKEIEELLGVPPEKIFPIHLGLDPRAHRPEPVYQDRHLASLGVKHPYILTVGTLEPRKNTMFLLELFDRLEHFDGELVIAGMKGWKYEPILERMKSSPRSDRIRYLEYVDDRCLPSLYAGAELFIFPSLYEGFGFPPLEAMACGTPVVSSSGGSLAEVLGDAAEVMDGYDMEQWLERVSYLLESPSARESYVQCSLEHVKQYDWRETARQTWEVYRKVG